MDELLPIFASAPPRVGGLGLTPQQLAGPNSFGGFSVFAFTLFVFPRMNAALGLRSATEGSFLATAAMALTLPLPSLLGRARAAQTALLYGVLAFRGACAVVMFSNVMMLLNAAAPPGAIGEVNGVGQAVGALVRGLGPGLAGVEWALFLATGAPGHQFGAFACVAAASVAAYFIYKRVDIEALAARKAAPPKATGAAAADDINGGEG